MYLPSLKHAHTYWLLITAPSFLPWSTAASVRKAGRSFASSSFTRGTHSVMNEWCEEWLVTWGTNWSLQGGPAPRLPCPGQLWWHLFPWLPPLHAGISAPDAWVMWCACDGGRGLMRESNYSTVGIGWVLLASATSRFSGYIKLAYCSSAKGQ